MPPSLPAVLERAPDDQPLASLAIRPWPDAVIDALGHDPRSAYVERFWLGILGPSTTFLLRRLASELEVQPSGFDLPLHDTARALGLGMRGGRSSPFVRTLQRCCQFGMAQLDEPSTLRVRRKLPPLTRHQVVRLPDELQAAHRTWQEDQLRTPGVEQLRTRARRLALSLLELGEGVEATERQLHRWKFHPAMAREATAWAWDRHTRSTDPDDDAA
jgi:hypothetical protein